MSKITTRDYKSLFIEIRNRIRNAQYAALKAVNEELIGLYWDIGKMIVSRQKRGSWGRAIVQKLARDLQAEFPGMLGFSSQNLWYMRQFYMHYCGNSNLQP